MIIAVPNHKLDEIWPDVEPLLNKAIDFNTGDISINDAKERFYSGEYLLICAVMKNEIQAAIAVELVTTNRKTCNIVLAGGKAIDSWLDDFMQTIQTLAIEQGAEALTIMGRKGWVRKMEPYGFKEKARILEVSL